MYEDKTLICKDCGAEFVFTAGEQEFYASKGFVNEPQRCKPCRDARKNAAKPEREMYTAQCAACGCEAAHCAVYNALLADAKQKFHLNHVKTVLYTAASALLR